jgi:AcrR family transcriptional regulator
MEPVKDKRSAILAATLDLISENGFHGTPMSLVAKNAGVSTGIIYHYFDSKDVLIDELFKAVKYEFAQAIAVNYDAGLPLREQFRLIYTNAIEYYIRHPKETVFMEQFVKSPFYDPAIEAEVLGYHVPLMQFLTRARHEQVVKDLPEMVLYTLTLEAASSLAQKHAAGIIDLTGDLIDRVMDACWDAIKR